MKRKIFLFLIALLFGLFQIGCDLKSDPLVVKSFDITKIDLVEGEDVPITILIAENEKIVIKEVYINGVMAEFTFNNNRIEIQKLSFTGKTTKYTLTKIVYSYEGKEKIYESDIFDIAFAKENNEEKEESGIRLVSIESTNGTLEYNVGSIAEFKLIFENPNDLNISSVIVDGEKEKLTGSDGIYYLTLSLGKVDRTFDLVIEKVNYYNENLEEISVTVEHEPLTINVRSKDITVKSSGADVIQESAIKINDFYVIEKISNDKNYKFNYKVHVNNPSNLKIETVDVEVIENGKSESKMYRFDVYPEDYDMRTGQLKFSVGFPDVGDYQIAIRYINYLKGGTEYSTSRIEQNLTTVKVYDGLIGSWDELLQKVNNNLEGRYILTKDIDRDLYSDSGKNIIGEFTGSFDGNGKTIRNLTIDQPLFEEIGETGRVMNFKLHLSSFSSSSYNNGYNGVITNINNGLIERITLSGSISSIAGRYAVGITPLNNEKGIIRNVHIKYNGIKAERTDKIYVMVKDNLGTITNFVNEAARIVGDASSSVKTGDIFLIAETNSGVIKKGYFSDKFITKDIRFIGISEEHKPNIYVSSKTNTGTIVDVYYGDKLVDAFTDIVPAPDPTGEDIIIVYEGLILDNAEETVSINFYGEGVKDFHGVLLGFDPTVWSWTNNICVLR